MSRLATFTSGLYSGDISFDFVGRRKIWYIVSAVLLVISLGAIAVNGLKWGVEFSGGAVFTLKSESCTVESPRDAVGGEVPSGDPIVTELNGQSGRQVRVQTVDLTPAQTGAVSAAFAKSCDVPVVDVSTQVIGPSWGEQITKKALTGLLVFLILIVFYLSITFEWRMAVAALVALFHDVFITIGIYALVGFEVTPATVIGVLTILGYSLYDTVVVFDKIRENTRGITASNRYTYSDATNLAVNQTVVRSINTTVTALLPVGAILVVGTVVLGTGPLKDLSLALFVGIAIGAYSSIFIAPSLLAVFKEREPAMQALRKRVMARRAQAAAAAAAPPVAVATAGAGPARPAVQDTPRKVDRPTGTAPTPAARPMKAGGGRPPPAPPEHRSQRGQGGR